MNNYKQLSTPEHSTNQAPGSWTSLGFPSASFEVPKPTWDLGCLSACSISLLGLWTPQGRTGLHTLHRMKHSGAMQIRLDSPPGSSVRGVSQARILQWVAFPSPGDLPNPGTEPRSLAWQADSLATELPGKLMQIRSVQEFLCEGFLDLFTFIMENLNTKEVKEDWIV